MRNMLKAQVSRAKPDLKGNDLASEHRIPAAKATGPPTLEAVESGQTLELNTW